ncbi:hypothetical protein AAFN85_18395 [Mucilaginibacter sp. CAU 1740]|uniref:hypothetical protein n=1 Tax=Mucilaginibacter sp. CAU 1740 TaxID=3140365 RepID=UPI00325B93C1
MRVLPFDEQSFAEALSNEHSTAEVIRHKTHFAYFLKYLGDNGIRVKTMVIEDGYISKDYLHDYASYYAFCFAGYEKICKRIHFFSTEFDEIALKAALLNPAEEAFWNGYKGFIVSKPLPITVIGYTVLSVYPDIPEVREQRIFSALRDYKIHFFGKELTLKSLAFQEQDSVIAACATTAIWSMLNRASTDHHTILKVPSEITKGAGLSQQGGRLFPNSGLEIRQICRAIINCGLEPEVNQGNVIPESGITKGIKVVETSRIKQLIYAYERIGIPIILCIQVPHRNTEYGFHAVAVAGYKMAEDAAVGVWTTPFVADRMEKFYVHDDQFGPFAWVKFLESDGIESPWSTNDEAIRPTYVINAVIPVYPKIRITYENILDLVTPLDGIIKDAFGLQQNDPLYWDIKLDFSESFKRYVMQSSLDDEDKLELIKKSMPKYIWVVTCYVENARFFDFTFDATGVNNAMLGLEIIPFATDDVTSHFHKYLSTWADGLAAIFQTAGGSKYIEHFRTQLETWK